MATWPWAAVWTWTAVPAPAKFPYVGSRKPINGDSDTMLTQMLFNFYTTDACFLADTWQITSKGMFAGSCIGVILLTMSLEFLRRAVKTYDRYLIRQHELSFSSSENLGPAGDSGSETVRKQAGNDARCAPVVVTAFRPNAFQQAVRALLHMVQFAVAYIIML